MLDTDTCIYFLNRTHPSVVKRVLGTRPDDLVISAISAAELSYGASKSRARAKSQARIRLLFSEVAVVPFDEPAFTAYGQVRPALEELGKPIGPLDTLIAAHALSLRATLVTHNVREFSRVRGLRVENWAA